MASGVACNYKNDGSNPILLLRRNNMSTVTEKKESGNKSWVKITGSNLDIISKLVNQPIKEESGRNPEHIDCPIKQSKKGK